MRLKFLEGKYLVNTRIEECSALVKNALNDVGLKNVTVKKEVSPRYLLMEYSPGWVGKALEIEFVFNERKNGTEVSVRWPFASEIPPFIDDKDHVSLLKKHEEEKKQTAERLIEEFKKRIGATDIRTAEEENVL
ncbi:MAG TPA: hypothetical protein VEC97_02315 [Candidatus Acidoferrales bacterium]|nr:hypothetical protein [Candidatus Acidoferrales bacterium]